MKELLEEVAKLTTQICIPALVLGQSKQRKHDDVTSQSESYKRQRLCGLQKQINKTSISQFTKIRPSVSVWQNSIKKRLSTTLSQTL
jgi:hypothetical protein